MDVPGRAHLQHISLVDDDFCAGVFLCQSGWPHDREWHATFADNVLSLQGIDKVFRLERNGQVQYAAYHHDMCSRYSMLEFRTFSLYVRIPPSMSFIFTCNQCNRSIGFRIKVLTFKV